MSTDLIHWLGHDSFSPDDVERISGDETVIFTTPGAAARCKGAVQGLRPGDSGEAHGVKIEGVVAYNKGKAFHLHALRLDRGDTLIFEKE